MMNASVLICGTSSFCRLAAALGHHRLIIAIARPSFPLAFRKPGFAERALPAAQLALMTGSNATKAAAGEPKATTEFLPFAEALVLARSLGLANIHEWKAWSKEGQRPRNVPAVPNKVYKDDGWQGWGDWLGKALPKEGARPRNRAAKAAGEPEATKEGASSPNRAAKAAREPTATKEGARPPNRATKAAREPKSTGPVVSLGGLHVGARATGKFIAAATLAAGVALAATWRRGAHEDAGKATGELVVDVAGLPP